jgi:hypothetical protein
MVSAGLQHGRTHGARTIRRERLTVLGHVTQCGQPPQTGISDVRRPRSVDSVRLHTISQLRQFGGLGPGFLHNRNIRIGILPESEEILVRGGRFRAVSGSGQSSGELETRHWSHRIVQHDSRMVKNFLKLSRCLAMAAHSGVSEATHVDRIENSEPRWTPENRPYVDTSKPANEVAELRTRSVIPREV